MNTNRTGRVHGTWYRSNSGQANVLNTQVPLRRFKRDSKAGSRLKRSGAYGAHAALPPPHMTSHRPRPTRQPHNVPRHAQANMWQVSQAYHTPITSLRGRRRAAKAIRTAQASPPVGWCRHAIVSRAIVSIEAPPLGWSRQLRDSVAGGGRRPASQIMGPPGLVPWQGELHPEGAGRKSLLRNVYLSVCLSACLSLSLYRKGD